MSNPDKVHEACQEMINLVNDMRKFADENEESLLERCCLNLTFRAGELAQAVIEYIEPDAGMESY